MSRRSSKRHCERSGGLKMKTKPVNPNVSVVKCQRYIGPGSHMLRRFSKRRPSC